MMEQDDLVYNYFYQKEDEEDCCKINIDKFLSLWWVKNILNREGCQSNEDENTPRSCAALPVNVFLFLKWFMEDITKIDYSRRKKVIISISTHLHLDYVAALTYKLKEIMRLDSCKPELKEKLLSSETFSVDKPFWPLRWFVHIQWNKLRRIPHKLWQLEQVEFVDFSKTYRTEKLMKLPHEIGNFKSLKYLNLSGNVLMSLPLSLGFCSKLEKLELSNNCFYELPLFLKDMPKLEWLFRGENNFDMSSLSFKLKFDDSAERKEAATLGGVDRLVTLASKAICRERFLSPKEIGQLDIPRQLKRSVQDEIETWKYCYGCQKGLEETETTKCSIYLQEFVNSTTIPVFCHTCHDCEEEVGNSLQKLNPDFLIDVSTVVHVNHDVSISHLHSKNCTACRRRRKLPKFLRRLFLRS